MMTNWYNNLKKNWPKLHDSTNSDGNGHCLIIKRDENDPDVEIGFWLGEDNATAFFLTAIYFFLPKTQEFPQIICMIQKKSISLQRKLKMLIMMKKLIEKIQNNHIFRGLASLGNVWDSPIRNKYRNMSDRDILREDWETIGNDMRKALSIYTKEINYARR